MTQISVKWTEIYNRLSKAYREDSLEPLDMETLALAAYLTGRDVESFEILERAHHSYLYHQKTEKAVRCTFWLGLTLMNAGEKARGSGWIARGERLLSKLNNPDNVEKGFLLIPRALGELTEGDVARAREIFEMVASLGEQYHIADLKVLGRLGIGQAMIRQGDILKGLNMFDESMVTTETEEVFPLVNGIAYCTAIETCREIWDIGRAQEWTLALTRWCDAQPGIVPFRGECMVRRAEIFQFHGEWPKALDEISIACEFLANQPGNSAAKEAYYRKAELHRVLGELEKAEDCYREAAKRGKKPQPGLALLRMSQGNKEAAETSIRNSLKETKDRKDRAELLPAVVNILISVNQTREAIEAANELADIADHINTPYLHAMSDYCQGVVFIAKGKIQPALDHLQSALKIWNSLQLPYESACAGELKGLIYRELKDKDNSDAELSAAQWVFEQLRAMPDLDRINHSLKINHDHMIFGLTLRELQVLNLVASGKTNKFVADKLFISERTVDRHMSNIFNKLGVSSRTEATTFALTHKILR